MRELASAVKKGLLALSVGVGLAVVHELFEAEVTRLAGPKGKHDPVRRAYRHGQESRQVTLGGRRVQVDKPRVRSVDDQEIELRTFRAFAGLDLLNAAALQRMLAGRSTRRYAAGLEPVRDVEQLATSKSAVSRRFVQGTEDKLAELFGRDLSQLDPQPQIHRRHADRRALCGGRPGCGCRGPQAAAWSVGGQHREQDAVQRAAGQPDRPRAGPRAGAAVRD